MSEEILKTSIPRREGYLYFCRGNPIVVCEAKMGRGSKKEIKDE